MTEPIIRSADHITDTEAKRVAIFASDIGEYLSLPRYRYSVMVQPCDEGALASIHTVEHRHIAQIHLSVEWMDRSEEERMNTVIHEVCHLLHRDVDFAVSGANQYMHEWEFRSVYLQYQREVELMVDYLAQFIQNFSTVARSWELSYSTAEAELAG